MHAIAGLAYKWKGPETGDYLTGLWNKDLLRGLMWEPLDPVVLETPTYIAPSWSWASTRGSVRWIYRLQKTEYYVEIDLGRTACIPKGLDPLGEEAAGWLFIRGAVVEGTLLPMAPSESRKQNAFVESRGMSHSFSVDNWSHCSKLVGQTVFCLRYCTDMSFSNPSETWYNRRLILERVLEEDLSGLPEVIRMFPNLYRRIGIQEICHPAHWSLDVGYTMRSLCII